MPKGFTLIELLIVLAVVGLLAAVVTLGVAPLLDTVRERAQAAELARVEQAVTAYLLLSDQSLSARITPAPIGSADADAPFVSHPPAPCRRTFYSMTPRSTGILQK